MSDSVCIEMENSFPYDRPMIGLIKKVFCINGYRRLVIALLLANATSDNPRKGLAFFG